ncbi:MAG: type IV toxin-antitoxin system AbiEi family antitoxin domain-containing protein [Pseudonocardia sp.]
MLLESLVARQAGVISLRQAVECGLSAATVHRRARAGSWLRLHPGVYLVGGHRYTDEVRVRAVALWAGEGATVTGAAAAFWHGMLPAAPAVLGVTVPGASKPRPQQGIHVQRRDLDFRDRVAVRDVWVTGKPLTALETAAALPDGSAFLDRALQRHVRFPALYRAHCRHLGRAGSARAGRLLVAAADRADSAAERLLVSLLRGAGLTGWVVGHPFGTFRLDVAFPARRLAVEVDGWAWHVDVDRFRNDRRKGNALAAASWDLLRYTWHDLDGRPAQCVAEIAGSLARAA